MKPTSISILLLSASSFALATPSLAQETAPAPAPADAAAATGDSAQVPDIVVTGSLRSARRQDVPMSVTLVGATEFEKSGFKEVRELQLLAPGVQVARQGAQAIFIRGSGTASQNPGTEQSVGMVIDGVVMGFVDDDGSDVADLDHIEVYRGPQGTQFAKNASAGVISITTKNPILGQWGGNARIAYGEHNDTNATATLNVPIADNLAGRFTGSFQHRDGVFDNVSLGQKQGQRDQIGVRGKLLWQPTDRTSALLSVDFRREKLTPNFMQAWSACGPGSTVGYDTVFGTAANPHLLPPCLGALEAGVVPSPHNTTSVEADPSHRITNTGGASLELKMPLGGMQLISLTAYRLMGRHIFGPVGAGVYSQWYNHLTYDASQYSQELRLVSPAHKPLTYVLGAYFYKRVTDNTELPNGKGYGLISTVPAAVAYGLDQAWINRDGGKFFSTNTNNSVAGFADGSLHITRKFQINAGVRVTHDTVSASGYTVRVPGVFQEPGTVFKGSGYAEISKTGLTARVGPQFFATDNLQFYATYARGYKGPMVDTAVQVYNVVQPETVNAYEAGFKSSWFDRRLTLNVAVFDQKFKNFQVQTLNTTVFPETIQLGNAGGQHSRGVELEGEARPTPELGLQFGLDYLDAKFTDFKTSCYTTPSNYATSTQQYKEPQITDPSGIGGCYTVPGTHTSYTQAAGFPLVNAPKWTWRVGMTYNKQLAGNGGTIDFSANYIHRSSWYSAAPDPNLVNAGYGVAGFNIGYTPENGHWRAGAFVRNAFNQYFTAAKQANSYDGGIGGITNTLDPEAVRTAGVSFEVNF